MKRLLLIIFVTLFSVTIAGAFEIHGFKSGMSMDQAKSALEKFWCGSIEERGNRIVAYPTVTHDPLIVLNFKKGRLYRYQKRCYPEYAHFSQLAADKRRELGKPVDAWMEPANSFPTNKNNCMDFLWSNGKYTCKVSYTQNDLIITYEDKM